MNSLILATMIALPYADVSDRYQEPVRYMVEGEITKGVTPTKYGVQMNIKRGDAVVMLAKHLKLTHVRPLDINHTDVPRRQRAEVNALWERNIINDTGLFRSDELATRDDIALWVYNAYTYGLHGMGHREWITNSGLMKGDSVRGMRWDEGVTRGEFAIIVKRAKDTLGEYKDMLTN